MRRFAFLALPLSLLLAAPASAQHWNDAGPGKDLLSSTVTDFENFRERTPALPGYGATAAQPGMPAPDTAARGPIPLLDWVPPPPVSAAAPAATRRRSPPRRTARRSAPARQYAPRDTAPQQAAASTQAATGGADWERSLEARERELQRLRGILETDRLRYQQNRQPQLQ